MKLQISLALILFSFLGFAQEQPISLSLQEAIDYAIKNNTSAKNATLNIATAKKQKWETTAIGLPQISANIDYNNWIKQQVSLLPGELAGGQPGTFVPVAFGTKQSVNATATLKQLLFDGSYLVGLQSAKVFLEISKKRKREN